MLICISKLPSFGADYMFIFHPVADIPIGISGVHLSLS
jgi:hypothetical protein